MPGRLYAIAPRLFGGLLGGSALLGAAFGAAFGATAAVFVVLMGAH